MRGTPNGRVEQYRIREGPLASDVGDGNNGAFLIPAQVAPLCSDLRVIVSDGGGWDHLSVSCEFRVPSWEEMCWVKDLFFGEEECVVQYHPKKSEYVNHNQYVLHMWRRQGHEFPMPPRIFV